ncbi:MAG TPA: 50S ribosomal protein L24 [Patescibacteria group bacterium]|nr:50S ribosomal protein L24 [Patescibacteria group bacterium]
MKLKKGDTIIVTTGKDKGRKGKIEKILPEEASVVVAGVNMFKRHMKRRDEKNPGGIVDIVKPMHVAKVALLCPACGKPTRVGYVTAKNLPRGKAGEKVRVCRKCGKKI